MGELLGLLIGVLVVAALVALAPREVNRIAWRLENALALVSAMIILLAMLFVAAEVISRSPYVFNSPIPGHLELSELLMPAIVFLALSYTQATGGHVRMTLAIDLLPRGPRRFTEIAIKLLSLAVYAVLCFYSAKHAYGTWKFSDVTMSPPYFLVWPAAAMAPIGFFLSTLRIYLEVIHSVFPTILPETEPGLVSAGLGE
jgi:TRAP-type C4-dicarboxylate transport system permease small subunit